VVWLVIFGCFLVKFVYDDNQYLLAKTNAPKPTCPICPTCPSCSTPQRTGGKLVPPEKTVDIRCQNLAECPARELSRRAEVLASNIEAITSDYFKYVKKEQDRCISLFPATDMEGRRNCWNSLGKLFLGQETIQMGIYRPRYHSDVIAMKKTLADRSGDHDSDADSDYKAAGMPRFGNIGNLERITSDLRKLAGEVLSVPQHE
jgi:hypothetical protein